MGADRQTFLYDLPTLVTFLTGETGVHSNHLMSSVCSFGLKNIEKRAPTGVENGFGKMRVLDQIEDTHILNHDMLIGLGIVLGNFEMMVAALPSDLQMRFSHIMSGFAASMTAFLPSAKGTLLASECLLRRAIETRIRNGVPFRVSKEDFQTYVNADVRMGTFRGYMFSLWFSLTDDQRVPMPIGPEYEVHCLRSTHDRPVQLDFEEVTKLLRDNEVFLVLMQIAIFAVLSELDGVPPIRLFEAGEADARDVVRRYSHVLMSIF
jgi:hypothetical protein